MGKAIPARHPAVVLRSHYRLVRALLAVAMVAVVGLAATVVIVANDSDDAASTSLASPHKGRAAEPASTRYDGGPEEGTRGVVTARQPGIRYDGGPEEGAAQIFGAGSIESRPGVRYDGGPEEGSRGSGH
jgi:hypothetical protein